MMVHQNSDLGCRRRSNINLAGFLARSAVNGPGIRAVIWVQGCPIQCKGCFNQAFWSYSRGNLVCADDITDRILATKDIDGVTFSGGEPFAQADALASVGEQVQEAGYTVVTYTGYTFEQLYLKCRSCIEPAPECYRSSHCRPLYQSPGMQSPIYRFIKPAAHLPYRKGLHGFRE